MCLTWNLYNALDEAELGRKGKRPPKLSRRIGIQGSGWIPKPITSMRNFRFVMASRISYALT